MATFQQSLSDVTVPAVGSTKGSASQVVYPGNTANAINAVSRTIDLVVPILEKEQGLDAFRNTQKAAFELIQQHDQGLISSITFRRMKKELAIEHFTTFDRAPSSVNEALVSAFGANPVERQEKTTATVTENMILKGSVVFPNGTDAEKEQAGLQLEADALKAVQADVAIRQANASKSASDNEQMTLAARYVGAVAEPTWAVMQGLIDLSRDVVTTADEEAFFGKIAQDSRVVLADFERVALQGLQGLGSKGFKEGIDRIKAIKDSFTALLDPTTGVRGVASKLEFLKLVKAKTELQLIESAPLVNRLHTLIGSNALSVIVANMAQGKIEFGKAIRTQLEGLLSMGTDVLPGVTGEKREKALNLLDVMNMYRDPDKTSEYLINKDTRSAGLSVATDMINAIPITKDSSKAEKNTFIRQSAAAMHLATRFVRTPENRKLFLDTIDTESYAKKLSELAKTEPKMAGILARSAMRFGIGALRESMNESSRIRYDTQSRQLEFVTSPIETTPSVTGTLSAEVGGGPMTQQEALIIENGNRSLDLLDKYAIYDERFNRMSENQRRDLVIQTIGHVTGKGNTILLKGQDFKEEFDNNQRAGANSVVNPSDSDRAKDRIVSPFEEKKSALADITRKARTSIGDLQLPRLIRDKKGKFTVKPGQERSTLDFFKQRIKPGI